ncbi:ABC transporter substrate-binding protein [Enterobacter cloacae subsp. cloacae GS1]|nr:ABC transporter substrate-binding protein [Enterobacter cloacae subsp. cloacae GS1]
MDAIFIAPVVATGWEPVLKEAKDAEIPVFLLDRSIDVKDKSLYMTTVTADNVLEGKLIGDWLVKQVDGKPCNVVELQGTVGASVAIDRKKGFAEDHRQSTKHQKSSVLSPATSPAARVKRSWKASSRQKITAKIFAWFTPTTTTW